MKQTDLLWLCGFISLESDNKHRHDKATREILRDILEKLQEGIK